MFKIINKDIHCTRGDKGIVELKVPVVDGYYQFETGDKIYFSIKSKYSDIAPKIRKVITITEPTEAVDIELTKEDTTLDELINVPKVYYYDIALNEEETLVGYTDEGPAQFILYPEASNDN